MASLLGKADSTIVQAAFNESLADVPADLSDLHQRRAGKSFDDFLGMMNEAFDTQTKEDKEREVYNKEQLDKLRGFLATGGQNEHYTALMDTTGKDIAFRLKDFDGEKDSLEYKKIEAEMNRLVGISENNNATYQKLINSDLATMGAGKELDLFMQIVEDHNSGDGNKSKIAYNKELKDIEYTLESDPTVKMTMSELEKALNIHDTAGPSAALKVFSDVGLNSNKRAWDNTYITDTENALLKVLKTPNDKYNIMMERFPGMEFSFYEALQKPEFQGKIFDALHALPGIGLDIDGDGVKDTKDMYLNSDNAMKIHEAITKSHNGDEIIAKWLTNNVGEDIYKQGEKKRRTTNETKTTLTAGERAMNLQAQNFNSALKSTKPTTFQVSPERAITVDPVTKTITETTDDENQTITAQKAIDLLVNKAGYFNAENIFGDLSKWNVELPIVKKKGKPGNRLGRFINSFASDNE